MLNEEQARPRGVRGLLLRLGLWRDAATRARQDSAYTLYAEIVKQARMPELFTGLGVPDTPEGRFETVALHTAMVIRRLRRVEPGGAALAQELFDLMFVDMDQSLRAMGVGDLSVGGYVKRLARNFYARLAALDQGLGENQPSVLQQMLAANVYHGGLNPQSYPIERFVRYLQALEVDLAGQADPDLLAGRIRFAAMV